MCGRAFETYTSAELSLRYSRGQKIEFPERGPNFNLAPTQLGLVLREINGQRRCELFRWGLIPSWAKDVKTASKYSLINARAEEITEKPSFREPFAKRRCIVPLSGFYEWMKTDKGPKRPFCIRFKDQSIMSMAAVWERWISPDQKEEIYSFAIITTEANDIVKSIHTRMPVILSPEDEDKWLNEKNQNLTGLKKLLKPYPSELLEVYEVSTLVNSPNNNTIENLTKV